VLDALRAARCEPEQKRGQWEAKCPAHDDHKPSLSLKAGSDGTVLVNCHSHHCTFDQIAKALGLEGRDFFRHLPDPKPSKSKSDRWIDYDHPVAIYLYLEADRKPAYQVRRLNVYDRKGGKIVDKTFLQYRPAGDGWKAGLEGRPTIPFRLPELLAADPSTPVWVPEGEKDVLNLVAQGLLATCNTGGAGKFKDGDSEALRGRAVVLIRDNDQAGRDHVRKAAASLHGKAKSVKMLDLLKIMPDLPEKGDVSDFLQRGGTVQQLQELARQAEEWKPDDEGGGFVSFVSSPPPIHSISVALRPVPEFHERLIPVPFRGWLADISERACCPLDLPAMSAVVHAAGVVGRRVAIRPKRYDDWTVVANLWGMGVLPPGWLKTHSLEEPGKAVVRLEAESRAKHEEAMGAFAVERALAAARADAAKAALKDAARAKGKGKASKSEAELKDLAAESLAKQDAAPPTLRRFIVNDPTVEKIGELLAENPTGLLLYRDELIGFLMSLEKQGHEGDRAFYLESWNGTGSYSYDRIGRGSLFIPSNTLSVLGGIQPGRLAAYIRSRGSGANDDGLICRYQLALYPDIDRPYKHVDRWPDTAQKNRAHEVFRALAALDPARLGASGDGCDPAAIPFLRFAADAQEFFDPWFVELENRVRSSTERPCLVSHLAKYRSLLPSLALLFHLIEVVDGAASGPVSLDSARRAAAWCGLLEPHARRIYQFAFEGDPEPAQRLAERLQGCLPNPFKARDVLRKGWESLTVPEEVERAIALLEENGWVCPEEVPSTGQGGRPTIQYHINPRALKGDVS
jgi:putative DNA primase/helicase